MEAYLAKNINSMMVTNKVLYQLIEIIIVNDGSKDRTSEIAHEFAAKHPNCVRVIDKENGHYGSCINVALPVAKGKYIRILDADDYANTEAFERFIAALVQFNAEDHTLDLIISNVCNVNQEGKITYQTNYALPKNTSFTLNSVINTSQDFIGLHAITYRTEMLRAIGYHQTEGCPYTDTEWYIIPMMHVRSARYFEDPVMYYFLGRDGQTMQPEILKRDFTIVMHLIVGILQYLEKHANRVRIESNKYTQQLIEQKVRWIYHFCLLKNPSRELNSSLTHFDLLLKEIAPNYYANLSKIRTPPRKLLFFRYITLWRKDYSNNALLFRLYYAFHKKRNNK
jgi:glycosyltransferase involved in cell wall biosynthesis